MKIPLIRRLQPVVLLFSALLTACGGKQAEPRLDFATLGEDQQRLPENALAAMQTAEGVEVAQFAAEPLLTNPTSIAVDARGRVWLCEANNYRLPYNPKFQERPAGDRILILEDTDGDGRADDSKVFYQGPEVNAALGIAVLGNRIFVSHSPNILVFTDDNGDDRPDRLDTLITGIQGPDDDHGAHAVIFGPDGRYYFNYGNAGRQLLKPDGTPMPDQQGRPIRTGEGGAYRQGMAFRFDPDSSFVEVLGHNFRNNYELTVDPFGTVWQTDNDDDGNRGCRVNYVMEYGNYGYQDEVTGAGWRERRPGLEPEIPLRHWHLNDPGVVPNLLQTGAGSPAGLTYYSGELLPEPFRNQMIHCEALKNVVRAYPVQPEGAGYRAEIVNLLQSADPWFRPSDLAVAPDGSVLVADWYDPGVGGNKMDDIQRGRVYRLAPDAGRYTPPAVDLKSPEGAVQALLNPNMDVNYQAWTRLHAWGPEAEPALRALWEGADPHHRARALWLLARLPGKARQYIEGGLKSDNENLRITALRVARQLNPASLTGYLRQAVNDPAPGVRREAALALRYLGTPEAAQLWAELARQYDGQDRWYLEALGIGSDVHPRLYFQAWREGAGEDWKETKAGRDLVWRVRAPETTPLLAAMIADPQVDTAWLPRYFRAFHFKPAAGRDEIVAGLLQGDHPLQDRIRVYALGQISPQYVQRNAAFRGQVRQLLPTIYGTPEWLSAIRNMELREQAPQLLEYFLNGDDPSLQTEAANLLFRFDGAMLMGQQLARLPEAERQAVYIRLGQVHHPQAVVLLTRQLEQKNLPFPVQVQLVEALGNSWDGQHVLYDKLKAGELTGDLKNTAALKLMNCWDPEVRTAAPQYLSAATGQGGVLPPVRELVEEKGDIAAGRQVFATYCQTCHQVEGEGISFGPDLSAIGGKLAKDALYSSILYPSAGINFGYEGYMVRLQDGAMLSGIITSDTPEHISLKMVGGTEQTVEKANVAAVEAMDQSLMTANLQAVMSQRDLVNLVEYLSTLGKEEVVE